MATLRRARLADGVTGWCALYCVVVSLPLSEWLAGGNEVILQACFLATVLMSALLLMVVLARQTSSLVRVLETRFIVHCGRVSYGLYLFNDYVKADLPERLLRAASPHLWPHGAPGWVANALAGGTAEAEMLGIAGLIACFGVLLAVADISWAVVERPALRMKGRFAALPLPSRRPRPWPVLDGAAAAGLPEGDPSRRCRMANRCDVDLDRDGRFRRMRRPVIGTARFGGDVQALLGRRDVGSTCVMRASLRWNASVEPVAPSKRMRDASIRHAILRQAMLAEAEAASARPWAAARLPPLGLDRTILIVVHGSAG